MDISFRPIQIDDKPLLREVLYLAVFVPPGHPPYERSILDLPEISRYIDNWDENRDFGLLASVSDELAGAAWARLFSPPDKGYGYVDEQTPELTIALYEQFRNKGLGEMMMQRLFLMAIERGFTKVSLSVDKINPAFRLYERLGFQIAGGSPESPTMVKELKV